MSWVSPDNIKENQFDHIAISRRFRRSLKDVRNKRGADLDSDHPLMIANFRFKILDTRKKIEKRRKKYNIQKLQRPSVRKEFKLELKNRFSILSTRNENTDIQGDSGGICTTLENDSMSDSKQKSSYEHGSNFKRLRSYDRLKLGIEAFRETARHNKTVLPTTQHDRQR